LNRERVVKATVGSKNPSSFTYKENKQRATTGGALNTIANDII